MTHRPVIVVAGRHRPHEQLLLAYSALLGVSFLTVAPPPGSVTAAFPAAAVTIWAAAMGLSGVVALAGCWWRGERGLGLELGGLLMNAGALVFYASAAFAAAGMRALLPGGIVLAWAAANMWRAGQAYKDIQAIRDSS